MTFREAINAIQICEKEMGRIDEELNKIEEQANQTMLRVQQLMSRRSECRGEIIKAARVIIDYEHGCPSTAPVSEHPTLLE